MRALKATEIIGSPIRAVDGDAGTVSDLLFNDQSLAVRWIVVRIGSWLNAEHVLVAPQNLVLSDTEARLWQTSLTIEDFRKARSLEDDLPVSLRRSREIKVESGISPFRIAPLGMPPVVRLQSLSTGDRHLRSTSNVRGYEVLGDSGKVGQVVDFIVSLPEWTISAIEFFHSDYQRTQAKNLRQRLRIDADRKIVDLVKVASRVSPLDDHDDSQSAKAGRRPFGH